MSAAKRKGDRAELEVQALLRDLLGVPARRKLGAGRRDDTGDIEGVDDTTIQVKSYSDVGRAVRECLDDLEEQHARTSNTFAAGFVRRPGGRYFVVLSPEMWATYWREATAGIEYVDVGEELTDVCGPDDEDFAAQPALARTHTPGNRTP